MSAFKIMLTNDPEKDGVEEGDVKWTTNRFEATHAIIDGTHYVRSPGGNWAPDYSHPDTAQRVKRSVDDAYAEHWSIDRWRK